MSRGRVVNQGNSFVVDGSVTPGDENGGEEKSNGVLSILEQESNGNVYTNPTGVPPDVQGIGNGVVGPSGEGFEKDLNRMLTEFGQF